MKIFYEYRCMTVTAEAPATVPKGGLLMDDSNLSACFAVLTEGRKDVWVHCKQGLRRFWQYCRENYIFVKAAGGLVHDVADGRELMISRNGHWDLPKGMVEPGETLRQAALREVAEETGIHVATAGHLLKKTIHIYNLYGGWHIKQTTWFSMEVPEPCPLAPQTEEGITAGDWVTPEELRQRLSTSFASLREISD